MRRITILIALAAFAAVPASASAAGLRAGVGKADITPAHGLLPGRLDPGRPRGRRPAHAAVLARDGAGARRPQGRARADRPVHGPRRDGQADRRGAGLARVLRAQHPDLRLAHPLGPRRLRELPHAEHRGAQPPDRHRPAVVLPPAQPRPGRPPALHLPGAPDRDRDPPRRRRPRGRRGRLGLGAHHGAHAQPQPRGPPGQPRRAARVRPGQGVRGPRRLRAHHRPRRERAAGGQGRAPAPGQGQAAAHQAGAGADRRLVHVRRPRHRHEVDVPVLQRRPSRLGAAGVRAARAQGGQGAAPPGGDERVRQQQRGRHVRGAGPPRPGGVGLRGPGGGGGDAARVAGRPGASSRAPRRSTCAGRGSASAARPWRAGPWPASPRWACRS